MKHLFIINPAAGKRESTAQLEKRLAELTFDHEVVYTEKAGDARRITEQAAALGDPIRIYACGGDGTLNEVVNGAAGFDNVAVTVFSGGSGNDFVKLFSEPKAFFDLERLLDAQEAEFDMMYGKGISRDGEIVDMGVEFEILRRSGAWFYYGETRLGQGRDNVKQLVRENKALADELGELLALANIPNYKKEEIGARHVAAKREILDAEAAIVTSTITEEAKEDVGEEA